MFRIKIPTLIFLVIFLCSILRFYQLGVNPPSLDWDEASIGWNAYNLYKTGSDEYGVKFPVSIRSFNDYKPGLYTYLTIFPVALFGLNEFSVRFVSAVVSIFLIISLGIISLELTRKKRIVLITMLAVSITPWAVQFGRVAFESYLSVVCFSMGYALFLMWIKNKKISFCLFSAVLFILSMYAYHSPRIIVPIFIFGLFILYFKRITKEWKKVLLVCLFSVLLLIPLVRSSIRTGSLTARFSEVNILNNPSKIVVNYLSHFDPRFLLFGDNNNRHHAPASGEILFVELFFICIAIYKRKVPITIIFWLLISPISASITNESPHVVRAMLMFPALAIISSIGFYEIKKIPMLTVIMVIGCFVYFLNQYFINMPIQYAKSWQYGYKELVNFVKDSDLITVTTGYDQPYIYFLFYGDQNIIKNNGDFSKGFKQFTFSNNCPEKGVIVRSPEDKFCIGAKLIKTIYFPDGSSDFLIYEKI